MKRVKFRCFWCDEDKYGIPILVGRDVMSGLLRQLFSCKTCDAATDSYGLGLPYDERNQKIRE